MAGRKTEAGPKRTRSKKRSRVDAYGPPHAARIARTSVFAFPSTKDAASASKWRGSRFVHRYKAMRTILAFFNLGLFGKPKKRRRESMKTYARNAIRAA
ncbi:hypothetical protein B5F40_12785 [Gordonibacter sp. An230]|nr:hypothetical protein B5F40_12785 [Gordonibacter sp. An230]